MHQLATIKVAWLASNKPTDRQIKLGPFWGRNVLIARGFTIQPLYQVCYKRDMMAALIFSICQPAYRFSSVKTFSVVDSRSNLRPMLRLALPALMEEFLVLMVTWTDW